LVYADEFRKRVAFNGLGEGVVLVEKAEVHLTSPAALGQRIFGALLRRRRFDHAAGNNQQLEEAWKRKSRFGKLMKK
jgi:hypothetical protein